ncbi:hypothetical protein KIPB_008512, partial [Kipferlia bialata]
EKAVLYPDILQDPPARDRLTQLKREYKVPDVTLLRGEYLTCAVQRTAGTPPPAPPLCKSVVFTGSSATMEDIQRRVHVGYITNIFDEDQGHSITTTSGIDVFHFSHNRAGQYHLGDDDIRVIGKLEPNVGKTHKGYVALTDVEVDFKAPGQSSHFQRAVTKEGVFVFYPEPAPAIPGIMMAVAYPLSKHVTQKYQRVTFNCRYQNDNYGDRVPFYQDYINTKYHKAFQPEGRKAIMFR